VEEWLFLAKYRSIINKLICWLVIVTVTGGLLLPLTVGGLLLPLTVGVNSHWWLVIVTDQYQQ